MFDYRSYYEKIYGPIPEGYVIHHIDHNRQNNKPYNLVALPNELHTKYHWSYNNLKCYEDPKEWVENKDRFINYYQMFEKAYLEVISYANEKVDNYGIK